MGEGGRKKGWGGGNGERVVMVLATVTPQQQWPPMRANKWRSLITGVARPGYGHPAGVVAAKNEAYCPSPYLTTWAQRVRRERLLPLSLPGPRWLNGSEEINASDHSTLLRLLSWSAGVSFYIYILGACMHQPQVHSSGRCNPFLSLSLSLSVCLFLSVSVSVCLLLSLSICLCLSVCLSVAVSVSICLSVCL